MAKNKFQWEADSGEPRDQAPPGRDRGLKKREAKAAEDLIDQLLPLSDKDLASLPISAGSIRELKELRGLEGTGVRGGLRRQRMAVAGWLRQEDLDELRAALPDHRGGSPREAALRNVERWRTRLLEGGDPAMDELLTQHPDGDRQRLRQLVRQARKDAARPGERSSKAFRELFGALRELLGA